MKKFRNIFILFVVALVGVSLTSCNDEDLVTDPYSKSGVNLLAYGPSPILRNTEIRLTGTNMQKVDKVIFPGNAIVERSAFNRSDNENIYCNVPDETVPGHIRLVAGNDTIVSIGTLVFEEGTNWQDAVFRTAIQHSHQLSAQGGTDKIQYYVSGSYMSQEGTIIGSKFDRFSVRTNLDAQLNSWLKLGLNATFSNTNDNLKLADSDEGIINYSLTTIPSIPIYNVDGSYSSISQEGYTNPNPVALALMDEILLNRKKLTGNIFFEVNPNFLKDIVWHAEVGYDISSSKGEQWEPTVNLGTWHRTTNRSSIQKNSSTFWQLKNYLTYTKTLADRHNLTAMLGQECWESKYDYSSIANTNLPSDEVHNPKLGQGSPQINYGFGSSSMASFFTRWTYIYHIG